MQTEQRIGGAAPRAQREPVIGESERTTTTARKAFWEAVESGTRGPSVVMMSPMVREVMAEAVNVPVDEFVKDPFVATSITSVISAGVMRPMR